MAGTTNRRVRIAYTNWRGETEHRTILPGKMHWGSTRRHAEHQWLLEAWCLSRKAARTFAMKDILEWIPEEEGT